MKLLIESGSIDVFFVLPSPVVIYHKQEKRLEIGFYIFSYFLSLNISK
jgi:hypothetical protein